MRTKQEQIQDVVNMLKEITELDRVPDTEHLVTNEDMSNVFIRYGYTNQQVMKRIYNMYRRKNMLTPVKVQNQFYFNIENAVKFFNNQKVAQ